MFAQESSGEGSSTLAFLLPMVILGGLFYVLLILPQRRKQKKAKSMRESVSVGDEVRTIGGILGTVVSEEEDTFTIDIGGQRMRVIKRAIAGQVEDESS